MAFKACAQNCVGSLLPVIVSFLQRFRWVLSAGWLAGVCLGADLDLKSFHPSALKNFSARKAEWQSSRTNVTAAISFGRAAYELAVIAGSSAERAGVAEQGITACRGAAVQAPKEVGATYYLAMNLGELARTKLLAALKLVKELEELFLRARALDEKYDFAGPDRCLGMLYSQAPGWPTSVGSKPKAREHLRRAIELRPEYPHNWIAYAEVLNRSRDRTLLAETLKSLDDLWPKAKKALAQDVSDSSWASWEESRSALKVRLAKLSRGGRGRNDDE